MAQQRQRTFYVLFSILAASACTVSGTFDGERSCGTTSLVFNNLRIVNVNGQNVGPTGVIYDRLTPESTVDAVCKIDETCCSSEAEDVFQSSVSEQIKGRVTGLLSEEVLKCHNHSFHGELINFIGTSKSYLLQAMRNAYGIYFTPYLHIYDDFYNYMKQTVITGDTCNLPDEFNKVYFKVYTAAFFGNPGSGGTSSYPQTNAFEQCFYQYFFDNNAEAVTVHYRAFTRSYNHTMYYLRALRYADLVLEQILDFTLTDQCKDSLMRMSYCAQCAGYDTMYAPCQGLCLNSMRGCLLELAEIVPGFERFSRALLRMKEVLEGIFNPFIQFSQFPTHFFTLIDNTGAAVTEIKNQVLLNCDASGPRNKRSAHLGDQTHLIEDRQAFDLPLAKLNASAQCFKDLLDVFTGLPEQLCREEWVSDKNSDCWTGKDMGSYGREVVSFDRPAQTTNPEVLVCSRASHFTGAIRRLGKITQELDILTGEVECNRDDEDCFFYQNARCDFFDFSDLDSTLDEDGGVASAFFSGSGESPGCNDDVTPTTVTDENPTTAKTDDITATADTTTHFVVNTDNGSFSPPFPTEDPFFSFPTAGVSITGSSVSLVLLLAAAVCSCLL